MVFLKPVCNSSTFSFITIGITYIVICLPEVFNKIFPQYAHKCFGFIGTAFSYIIQTFRYSAASALRSPVKNLKGASDG